MPGGVHGRRADAYMHIMAKHGLLHSFLRQNKLLRMHMTQKPANEKMNDREWDTAAELEACLYLTKPVSKLVQTEQHPVSAFRAVLLQDLLDGFRAPTLDVINLQEVGVSPRLPRIKVAEGTLTIVGKTCKDRCLLEAERRFAGNDSEELTGADVEINDNDGLCTLLDPRTNNCKHLEGRSMFDVKEMKDKLRTSYVDWGFRAREWRRGPEKDSEDAVEVESQLQRQKRINKGVDVVEGLFSDEDEEEDQMSENPAGRVRRRLTTRSGRSLGRTSKNTLRTTSGAVVRLIGRGCPGSPSPQIVI